MDKKLFNSYLSFKYESLETYGVDVNINQYLKLFTNNDFVYSKRRIDFTGWKKQTNSKFFWTQEDWNYYILSELLKIGYDQYLHETIIITINSKFSKLFNQFNYLILDDKYVTEKFRFVVNVNDNIENIWIGNVEIMLDGFETINE